MLHTLSNLNFLWIHSLCHFKRTRLPPWNRYYPIFLKNLCNWKLTSIFLYQKSTFSRKSKKWEALQGPSRRWPWGTALVVVPALFKCMGNEGFLNFVMVIWELVTCVSCVLCLYLNTFYHLHKKTNVYCYIKAL